MFIYQELEEIKKMNVRGGEGMIRCRDYLQYCPEGMRFSSFGLNEMEPGSTIPEHCHPDSAELYFIVGGTGTGIHNGRQFSVNPCDAWLCNAGETHGILNDSQEVLSFVSLFFTK